MSTSGFFVYLYAVNGLKNLISSVIFLCLLPGRALAGEVNSPIPDYLMPVVELLSRGDAGLMPLDGNTVEVISEGHRQWEVMLEDIKNARQSICFEYYRWKPDDAGKQIRAAVLEKIAEGIPVKILLENICNPFYLKEFYSELEAAGAELLYFTETDRYSSCVFSGLRYRDHRKILLIDDEIGYMGGMNIGNVYRDEWRDTNLRLQGPVVAVLARFFDEMWVARGGATAATERKMPAPAEGGIPVQLFTFGAGDPLFVDAFCMLLNAARERVYVQSPYFCPTDSMLQALVDAAARGVDVRILLPEKVDIEVMKLVNESCYERCLEAGVRIYEYQPRFDHTKMVVCDGISLIGSTNLDYRSLLINYELMALMADGPLTERLSREYLDRLEESEEITLEGARAAFRKDKHDRSLWFSLRPLL